MKNQALLLFLMVISSLSFAHHSFIPHYFPDQKVNIEGTVERFQFRNPHSFLIINSVNAENEPVQWTCEIGAAAQLKRVGWTAQQFTKGERIKANGAKARRDPTGCYLYKAEYVDGRILSTLDGIIIPGVMEAVDTSEDKIRNTEIYGTWSRDMRVGLPIKSHLDPHPFKDLINDKGQDAHAAYDPLIHDPAKRCNPASPMRVWDAPESPTSIRREDNRIILQHEWMDSERIIDLNENVIPDHITPSPLGTSIGHFDESTLIITTSGFSTGILFTYPGMLMGENAQLTEKLYIDQETEQLRVDWQLDDPEFYTSPMSGQFAFNPSPLTVGKYQCVPDALD
jgi:hypothetical protein